MSKTFQRQEMADGACIRHAVAAFAFDRCHFPPRLPTTLFFLSVEAAHAHPTLKRPIKNRIFQKIDLAVVLSKERQQKRKLIRY